MATLQADLVIQQGVTFEFIVELVGGPVSISGFTAQMQVRPFKSSEEILLDLSTDPGDGLTIDAGTRRITISIDEAVTRGLSWEHPAVYDLELRGEDKEWRVMQGIVTFSREVTR
jgi:hypothetical protein